MKDFFNNLVDRHLGTCETIQPRSLGRFESDQNSLIAADSKMAEATEHNQKLQTSEAFSKGRSPAVTDRNPDPIKRENDLSSLPSVDKNLIIPPTQSAFTEQHLDTLDSQKPSLILPVAKSRDDDAPIKSANIKQNQTKHSTLLDREKIIGHPTNNPSDSLNSVFNNNNPLPITSNNEPISEIELNHRIQAMLNHLAKDISSPQTSAIQNKSLKNDNSQNLTSVLPHATVPLLDTASTVQTNLERNNSGNSDESSIFVLPETKTTQLDTVVALPEFSPANKNDVVPEKNSSSRNIPSNHSQLEPPSWLSDMTTQLTQRLQDAEHKTDPVINVTIGRVEIKAVQNDTQKTARPTKKPTGVMTLDDYLKQRNARGAI